MIVIYGSFFNYFKNSVIVVFIFVVLILIVLFMVVYVFLRMKFFLNNILYFVIIVGMVIFIYVMLILIYIFINKMRIYDLIFVLIGLYVVLSLLMLIFIFIEFMCEILIEFEEVVKIDGCLMFRFYYNIIFFFLRFVLIIVGIYNGIYLWNEFVFVFVLISFFEKRILLFGIWDF